MLNVNDNSALRLYKILGESTIAFNPVDPLTKDIAKVIRANQYWKLYRFKDSSELHFYHYGGKSFKWAIAWSDGKRIWAIKGIGYTGEPILRITGPMAGTTLLPIQV